MQVDINDVPTYNLLFSDTGRIKTVESQIQKGKENKKIDLPQVDYREKKSAKSSTYRATPVSAYFP